MLSLVLVTSVEFITYSGVRSLHRGMVIVKASVLGERGPQIERVYWPNQKKLWKTKLVKQNKKFKAAQN